MFIRSLVIERFRGVAHLSWQPSERVNCLIGPGDAGKSTILSAIGLLLDPRPPTPASEFDYFQRKFDQGFSITAVLGDLRGEALAAFRNPPLQGWLDGQVTPLPDEGGAESVLVVRVAGSPEFEVSYSVLTPGEGVEPFPSAARQQLLLSRIASGARANTELRVGRGSLLDRHIGDPGLHGALHKAVAAPATSLNLPAATVTSVGKLETLFGRAGLPADLHLGLITPQGSSLLGLFGLLHGPTAATAIPVALAGTGTRQLALFELGANLVAGPPVVVLDEPEAGLEPYRQRRLIARLRELIGKDGQAFFTTHSPAVLQALGPGETFRYAAGTTQPVQLAGTDIERVRKDAPDALLARLPILAEGETEAGLLEPILNRFAADVGMGDIDGLGLRLVFRNGQPGVLNEAERFVAAGVAIGLFVDDELEHSGRRTALAANPLCAFGSWTRSGVRNIEEAVATLLAWEHLPAVLTLAAELRGRPQVDLLQQVNQALVPGRKDLQTLRDEHGEPAVRRALGKAMQSRGNAWFKSLDGGRRLGKLLLQVGLPDKMAKDLRTFWDQVQSVLK